MINESEWKWHGLPGHFCGADSCIFRLHTTIGKYKISTVGAMYRDIGNNKRVLEEIGLNRHYETYVFDLTNSEWSEIDSEGLYLGTKAKASTEEWDQKAEAMHKEMCLKYAKIAGSEVIDEG